MWRAQNGYRHEEEDKDGGVNSRNKQLLYNMEVSAMAHGLTLRQNTPTSEFKGRPRPTLPNLYYNYIRKQHRKKITFPQ